MAVRVYRYSNGLIGEVHASTDLVRDIPPGCAECVLNVVVLALERLVCVPPGGDDDSAERSGVRRGAPTIRAGAPDAHPMLRRVPVYWVDEE